MLESCGIRADELCEIAVLVNKRGLHARAAAKFVKVATTFKADVFVAKDDVRVPGNSIMGLMMLAAPMGARIKIVASGIEAVDVLNALVDLVARGFDEE